MEQSVESNFFDKFNAIASLTLPAYFTNISDFFFKKRFLRKSSKPGHENLVLITSTVQAELSTLHFNFAALMIQELRACRQITLVKLNGA